MASNLKLKDSPGEVSSAGEVSCRPDAGSPRPAGDRSVVVTAIGATLTCTLISQILAPSPFGWPQIFSLLAIALAALAAYLVQRPSAEARDDHDADIRLERRLEDLQDIRWEISENEVRYRDLLDSQADLISRRDVDGRLTFVNRSFAAAFGVDTVAVLGQQFSPHVLGGDNRENSLTEECGPYRRFVERVDTTAGPRWIDWEEHHVRGVNDGVEVQRVGRDVTAQLEVEHELAEARDQAEAANRSKSRFLAAMSHEIRTPMNGILGMASLLTETPLTPEQQTYLGAIDRSARTLLTLIDEILDFSKIEAGKLEFEKRPFALADCVQRTVELLAPRAHEKGLEIAWRIEPDLPNSVCGDEGRICQILLNLLSNAVKFTDVGGVLVTVSAKPGASVEDGSDIAIQVAVEDTGIGLSGDEMQRLFAEFEQAESAVRRRLGGTGLGLAISKRLAVAMGGDIRVASEPGRGSTFTFDLMLRCVGPACAVGSVDETAAARRFVLLAFDRALERHTLAQALAATGAHVVEADLGSAQTAVQTAAENGMPFDTLVVDTGGDVSAARAVLNKVRASNPGAQVRGVALVTAMARASLVAYRKHGFASYLVRPVRPSSLLIQLGFDERGVAAGAEPDRDADGGRRVLHPEAVRKVRRILFAEDNEVNALLTGRILEKLGHDGVHAKDGQAAVDAMRSVCAGENQPFDLILMDILMPGMDGVEATREINALYAPGGPGCGMAPPPVVALTANAFEEDRQRYLEAGISDYLAKPFDKSALEAILERWHGRGQGRMNAEASTTRAIAS